MTTTSDEYVREVEWALRDLPWSQREELVADLRNHLAELPPETDLAQRLGTPTRYASELRVAEGLDVRQGLVANLRARRPRTVIVLGAFALAIVLALVILIGGLVWIESYQPIRFDGFRPPAHSRSLPGLNGVSVDFHRGRPFELGVELVNTGPFTVRVLGVPHDDFAEPWHAQLRMGAPAYDATASYRPSSPFRPFDLRAGEHRFLLLKGAWWCTSGWDAGGGGETIGGFPVRYGFLWRKATADLPLPDQLGVNFVESCPSGGIPWPKR